MKRWWLSRRVFQAVYMVCLLIHIIPVVNHWPYSDWLTVAFGGWGYTLLAVDLYQHKLRSFRHRAAVPLFIFYALCAMSLLCNPSNAFVNGVMRWGVFLLCGAVLYITDSREASWRATAVTVGTVYVTVTATMAAVSVGMYMVQFQYAFTGPLGENFRMGVWENRLFGLFSSGNVGGSVMAIGLLFSVGLLWAAKRQGTLTRWRTIGLMTAAVLQLWHISLTLSRGTLVSLLAAVGIGCALCPLGGHRWPRVLARKAVCLTVAVTVLLGSQAVFRQVSLQTVRLLDSQGFVHSTVTGFDRIEYEDATDAPQDISNKRFAIWKAIWRLTDGKRLTGAGRHYFEYLRIRDTADWLTAEDHTYLTWSRGNAHNGYLQIIADAGVPALLAFVVFVGWCLVVTVQAYCQAGRGRRQLLSLTTAVVAYVLVNNLFETNMVLMGTNPIQAIFWLTAGVHMAVCHSVRMEKGVCDR